jgi:formate hydrogenlyase transcriptional activator
VKFPVNFDKNLPRIFIDSPSDLVKGLNMSLFKVSYPGLEVEIEMMADTELKKMEVAPSLRDKDYRTLMENVPVLIVRYNTELRWIYVNPAWEKVIGLSSAVVINKRVDEIPELPAIASFVEKLQEVLKSGTPQKIEFSWANARGKTIFVEFVIVPEYDRHGKMISLLAAGIDQTERREAEEQLRNSERNLRTTIDTIPAFVFSALPDGFLDFANKVISNYTGLKSEELLGMEWEKIIHPEDRNRAVENWRESMATGEPREDELRIRQANGEYHWFLARNAALRDEKGNVAKWYGALVNIEDQKRAEARLLQALDEIKKLQNQLSKENIVLREEIVRTSMFEEIVGASPALKAVLARIDKVAPTDSIVFITGETGTGKELVARAIHKRSPRASRAFVSVNCAAIPAPLIASELFGHEKGAFTGAHQRRLGRFELAEGGTIFLDEIGELPMETQIALLRVLQDQQFERLGGNQPIRANARVITATNRDLLSAIEAGSFRRDLFYRLNVFPIEIPPLRERQEDIPILVEYFIHRYAGMLGKKILSASRKTLDLLQSYFWPGNIRELQNVIERSIIVCDTENFSVDENWFVRDSSQAQPVGQPLSDMLVSQTREMIEAALAESGGRVSGPSGAAAKLGMPASTLESKIKSLKINKYLFKKSF